MKASVAMAAGPTPASAARGRAQVYLQAGEVFASSDPTAVTTILGSCVAVCLFDPATRVGGMNHFLLPYAVERERSAKFGNVATRMLVEEVLARGAGRGRLAAKVFGGACVIDAFRASGRHLGDENVQTALAALEGEGIPVVERDVGGARGRKVVFRIDDGAAWVRQL